MSNQFEKENSAHHPDIIPNEFCAEIKAECFSTLVEKSKKDEQLDEFLVFCWRSNLWITHFLISTWKSISFRMDSICFFSSVEWFNSLTKLAYISLNVKQWMHIERNNRNNCPAIIAKPFKTGISTNISPMYPSKQSWFHGKLRRKNVYDKVFGTTSHASTLTLFELGEIVHLH